MLELPLIEKNLFISVLVIFALSSVAGVLQLFRSRDKYKQILILLIAFGVCLELIILVFRAVAVKAFPLTGLFESMIILTVVFGLTYLLLSVVIEQVWFGSIMAWLLFFMSILSAAIAHPASQLQVEAQSPWVIFHALLMVLSGTTIVFAGAMAILFLLCRRRLKKKQLAKVVGRLPNIEKLERMNILGLRICFVLMTFGLVSGAGVAIVKSKTLSMNAAEWITDPKIVIIATAWILVGAILALRRMISLKGRAIALMTIVAVFLVLFAIVGATFFCGSAHNFSVKSIDTIEAGEQYPLG